MSAITGILNFNNQPISDEYITNIMAPLKKYPSNFVRAWKKENIFLGCHAQWITPESIGEELPFYDYEKQLAITADAIIDNRKELLQKLQITNELGKTLSDSKLILLAYDKWGEESPKHLVGDFSIVIWDEKEQKVFLARDFSGSRTLYYYYENNQIVISTTIEPLLTLPYIDMKINEQWIAEYLAISGVIDVVDSSITPYIKIYQVPPSHSISISKNRKVVKKYVNLCSEKKIKFKSNEEYVEAFQEIFGEAVKSRLRTFKKIGSQLSGGLDSGAVVSYSAKLKKYFGGKLHTYSYIPPKGFVDYTPKQLMPDERPFIKTTVDFLDGISENYLAFEGKDSYSEIDEFLEMLEAPYKFFENSFWQKGIFERASNDGVGVLLNGGRGNMSISWGSALDYYSLLLKKMKWVKLFQELNCYHKNVGGARFGRLPKIAKIAFPSLSNLFTTNQKYHFPPLINENFARMTGVYKKLNSYGIDKSGWFSSRNIYEQRKNHFEEVFHWNATNTKSTKLSLRYSLWERDPTNDIRVIRFCLSIPEDRYVNNGLDRALIRNSTVDFLPDKVRLNQKVRGIQGADWVYRMKPYWNDFISELEEIISNNVLLELINPELAKIALEKIKEGAISNRAVDPYYRNAMRIVIVNRFIKQFN